MRSSHSVGDLLIDGALLLEDGLFEIEIGGSAPGQFDMVDTTRAVPHTLVAGSVSAASKRYRAMAYLRSVKLAK